MDFLEAIVIHGQYLGYIESLSRIFMQLFNFMYTMRGQPHYHHQILSQSELHQQSL